MSDSSDSETPVIDSVYKAKRMEGTRTSHRQPTNFGVVGPDLVSGFVTTPSGQQKHTVLEVAEVLSATKKARDEKMDKKAMDVLSTVRDDLSGDADGSHDIAAFLNRFHPVCNTLAMASSRLRRVANAQEESMDETTDQNPEQATFELGVLIRRHLSQMSLARENVVQHFQSEPQDVVISKIIEMVEEQDVWDRAMRPSGTCVRDGVLHVSDYVPDLGTPSSVPYINESLQPHNPVDMFTLPCARGNGCIAAGHNIPGVSQFARPEGLVPYRAWIPPDVYNKWREEGIEPEPTWTCFFCHTTEVSMAVEAFARKSVTPPPLNLHEVQVDPTGLNGFPEQCLYNKNRRSVSNGIYGAFPMLSMLQFAPRRGLRVKGARASGGASGSARSGGEKNSGYTLVVPDFRFTSAANAMG